MESLEKQFSKNVKKNLQLLDKALDQLLNQVGIKMVKEVRTLQDKNKNYAKRELSNKTNYQIKDSVLTFGSNATSPNGYNYGLVPELGRKPGKWPNITAMEQWVRKKVALGHIRLNGDLGNTFEKRIRNLAFLIARSIKEKGIEGNFFYKQAFEMGNEFFLSKFNKVITEVFA